MRTSWLARLLFLLSPAALTRVLILLDKSPHAR